MITMIKLHDYYCFNSRYFLSLLILLLLLLQHVVHYNIITQRTS